MLWQGAAYSPLEAALALAGCGIPVCSFHYPRVDGSGWVASMVCSCDRPQCLQPCAHPMPAEGLAAATTDAERIRFWWQDTPDANVGLVTGVVCDVIDTDPDIGRRAFRALARRPTGLGPVARTATGRWLFFTAPSGRPSAVLADSDDGVAHPGPLVRWRGLDSFVLAPPSRTLLGNSARWAHPFATELPDPYELVQVLTDAATAPDDDDEDSGRLSRLFAPVRRARSRVVI